MATAPHIDASTCTRPALTVADVATRLGVHPVTVRRWAASGLLPAAKLGHGPYARLRFAESDVEALLTPQRKDAA